MVAVARRVRRVNFLRRARQIAVAAKSLWPPCDLTVATRTSVSFSTIGQLIEQPFRHNLAPTVKLVEVGDGRAVPGVNVPFELGTRVGLPGVGRIAACQTGLQFCS